MKRPSWLEPALVVAVIALVIAVLGSGIRGGEASETEVHQRGQYVDSSCQAGTFLADGACLDAKPSGPVAGVKAAADACAAEGGSLPLPSELWAARSELDLGDANGKDGVYSDSYRIEEGTIAKVIVVDEADRRWVVDEDLATGKIAGAHEYVCKYPATS